MKSPLTTASCATIFLATLMTFTAGVNGGQWNNWKGAYQQAANWQASLGQNAGGDGDTDGAYFLTWQRQLSGSPLAAGQAAGVPEPSTFLLLACALVALAGRRVQ